MSGFRRQLMGMLATRQTVRVVEGDLQFNSSESCRYANLLLPNTGIWRVDYFTLEKTAATGSPSSGRIAIYAVPLIQKSDIMKKLLLSVFYACFFSSIIA